MFDGLARITSVPFSKRFDQVQFEHMLYKMRMVSTDNFIDGVYNNVGRSYPTIDNIVISHVRLTFSNVSDLAILTSCCIPDDLRMFVGIVYDWDDVYNIVAFSCALEYSVVL